MPLESTTTRLQSITSKTIRWTNKETGQPETATVFQFNLDGFKKPFETFQAELVDMSMQGKMVRVGYTEKERNWTANDGSGRSGTTTDYRLENIIVVEGDTGTLDDVIAPQVGEQRVTAPNATVTEPTGQVTYYNGNGDERQADIRRAVALKAAIEFANGKMQAGEEQTEENILEYTNNFQAILESR